MGFNKYGKNIVTYTINAKDGVCVHSGKKNRWMSINSYLSTKGIILHMYLHICVRGRSRICLRGGHKASFPSDIHQHIIRKICMIGKINSKNKITTCASANSIGITIS